MNASVISLLLQLRGIVARLLACAQGSTTSGQTNVGSHYERLLLHTACTAAHSDT